VSVGLAALLALALLAIQWLFSAAEVVFDEHDHGQHGRDHHAQGLHAHPGQLHAATALGQSLAALGLGLVGAIASASLLGSALPGLAALAPSLLLGRLLPRAVARAHGEALVSVLARPTATLAALLHPLVQLYARALGLSGKATQPATREEIRDLIGAAGAGAVRPEDRAMIQRIFDLADLEVRDVMVPLSAVDALPREATLADAARRMVESGHSRLLVYKDRIDRMVGLVLHLDLLAEDDWSGPVSQIARPAFYVPQNKRIDKLFPELQRQKQRLAVVVDEYGGAIGILTVEDLLEQIVGQIEDESDRPSTLVRPGASIGEWLASGRAPIDEIGGVTGLRLPEGDYESIAGYLLYTLGRVPRPGERVSVDGYIITVTRANERAVQEVSLRAAAPNRQGPGGGLR